MRTLKVGEMLRRALSDVFMRGETHIPLLDNSSLTVSEVRVAPDLKTAQAFVMPLAGQNKEEILEALKIASPHIRHLISDKVELRYLPKIFFRLDESFEEAARINSLLKTPQVARDIERETTEE